MVRRDHREVRSGRGCGDAGLRDARRARVYRGALLDRRTASGSRGGGSSGGTDYKINRVEILPYEDQKLSHAPPDEVRRRLVEVIRSTRPAIAVTFDPNGANQHPDHVAISRFAADAISCAADARWYPEAGSAHAVSRVLWWAPVLPRELGRTPEPANLPGLDFLIDIAAFREQKMAALRAHRTQFPGLRSLFLGDDGDERRMPAEMFRLGWGPHPRSRPSEDLFAI